MAKSLSFPSLTRCERVISVKYVLHDEYWLGRVQSAGGICFLYWKVSFAPSALGFIGYTNVCPQHTHTNTHWNLHTQTLSKQGALCWSTSHRLGFGRFSLSWETEALVNTNTQDRSTTVKTSAAEWKSCLYDLMVVFLTLHIKRRLMWNRRYAYSFIWSNACVTV